MHIPQSYLSILIFTVFFSCKSVERTTSIPVPNFQQERDELYMLLAYTIVEEDWQKQKDGENTRGYNIGGVLVNGQGELVNWARNTTVLCDDKTQHAEVRMLQAQLQSEDDPDQNRYVSDHTVYTTLEPCMMCSGMMIFVKVKNVIYGQIDPDFGLNIKRLKNPINDEGRTRKPNSREKIISSTLSMLDVAQKLNNLFAKTKADYQNNITAFLSSSDAHDIFREAKTQLINYEVKYDNNKIIYNNILKFLEDTLPNNRENKKGCPCTKCDNER